MYYQKTIVRKDKYLNKTQIYTIHVLSKNIDVLQN